jgi:DNA-binding response OmpR family regulator
MAKSLSILVVEDDPTMRAMVGMLLETAGHKAISIASALEAGEILERDPVDLIITDVVMPKKDGLEFIQEVRTKWPTLPIIAVSGGGDHLAGTYCLKTARALGAAATLAKPFSDKVLLATVDEVMARKGAPAR